MGKRFRSSEGYKGSRALAKGRSYGKKVRRTEDKFGRSSSPNSLGGDKYEEREREPVVDEEDEEGLEEEEEEEDSEDDDEEEEEVYEEPSVYSDLLKKLEASSKLQADRLQRSKSKQRSTKDLGSNGDGDSDCASASDEDEDGSEGTANNTTKKSGVLNAARSSEKEAFDMAMGDDDVSDLENDSREENSNDLESLSQCQSKYGIHVMRMLSKEDTEKLLERKWEYSWNMPALDMANCRWEGTGDSFLKENDAAATAPYGLKPKLYKHWFDVYSTSGGSDFQSSKQKFFFTLCNSYRDILHHNKKPFYQKGSDEDSSIMDAYIMHSLNHVFNTRDVVTKNDAKLAKIQGTAREEVVPSDSFCDQGFTRPKVLILLPLASIALRLVRRLIRLTPSANKVNVDYMDRFNKEFGAGIEEVEDEVEAKKPSKPLDHQALFRGKYNDHFMVGIKFTRKSVRLYSDFYTSDIIVASPLGLITKIAEAAANKEKNVDYLSSIEILVVDHADVIAMQNLSHVDTVLNHLNLLPSKELGDIRRIRPWYVDEQARFYRQSIILSSFSSPDINKLFNQHCLNFEGKLRFSCKYKGVLPKVMLQIRQVYERFDCDSIGEEHEARFDYFVKKVFPKLKDSVQGGVMLFISSYFEFVRIRNFLKSQNASFCLLGEYTTPGDISRARNWFIQGQRRIMLYTERAYFYHRYKIRGVQNLIMYSLPERKEFYPEVLNMLEGSHSMTCTVLFSRYDRLRLERIVGSAAAKRMTKSDKGLFIFS